MAAVCSHLDSIAVRPDDPSSVSGCQDCLALGGTWVHLRQCLQCGKVGCCDSSPGKHATAHFNETSHPVVHSAEPGEEWSYCYVDDAAFVVDFED